MRARFGFAGQTVAGAFEFGQMRALTAEFGAVLYQLGAGFGRIGQRLQGLRRCAVRRVSWSASILRIDVRSARRGRRCARLRRRPCGARSARASRRGRQFGRRAAPHHARRGRGSTRRARACAGGETGARAFGGLRPRPHAPGSAHQAGCVGRGAWPSALGAPRKHGEPVPSATIRRRGPDSGVGLAGQATGRAASTPPCASLSTTPITWAEEAAGQRETAGAVDIGGPQPIFDTRRQRRRGLSMRSMTRQCIGASASEGAVGSSPSAAPNAAS